MAKTNILLAPSLELQDGGSKSLFITKVSSLRIIVGVKIPSSLDFNPIVPKPKKANKVEWEFYNVSRYLGHKIALGRGNDGC